MARPDDPPNSLKVSKSARALMLTQRSDEREQQQAAYDTAVDAKIARLRTLRLAAAVANSEAPAPAPAPAKPRKKRV